MDVVVAAFGQCNSRLRLAQNFRSPENLEELRGITTGLRFVHLDCEHEPRLDNPMFSTVTIGKEQRTVLDLFNLELPCSVMSLAE